MIRVLHAVSSMNCGGTETMLMNLYRLAVQKGVQFDFLVDKTEPGYYDEEIKALGGRLFYIRRWNGKNTLAYKKELENLLDDHKELGIVHVHIGSSAAVILHTAKKKGRYCIVHSHSTKGLGKSFRDVAFRICTYPVRFLADSYFACSKDAGEARFGKKLMKDGRCKILKNAIDLANYDQPADASVYVREEFGLSADTFVAGHVGRFDPAKNHPFILEVFAKIKEKNPDSILLLAGEGATRASVEAYAAELSIKENVIFVGLRKDIPALLSSFDCFIFPSHYEGLGIAAIEAEAMGLPCFINEELPKDLLINENVFPISLKQSPEYWAEMILSHKEKLLPDVALENVRKAGYDITKTAAELTDFYKTECLK